MRVCCECEWTLSALNVTLPCSYIIENGVCYLTIAERSYPKKLAFQYLEDLQREFDRQNRAVVETVARPYYFIKFGTWQHAKWEIGLQLRKHRTGSYIEEGFVPGHASVATPEEPALSQWLRYMSAVFALSFTRNPTSITSLLCRLPCRYLHPENKEAVHGHTNAAEHRQAERRVDWGAANNDPQYPGRAGDWREAW